MILLDTNVISEIRKIEQNKANANVVAWANALDFSKVYLSAIVIGELKLGVLLKRHNHDFVQADVLEDWLNNWVLVKFANRILPVIKDFDGMPVKLINPFEFLA